MTAYQSEDRLRIKRVRAEKAIQLAMQNRWSEATEVNRQIIELFPDDVDSHNRLGKALMELGQYPEAREAYGRAVKLDPSNTIAARNLQRLEQLAGEDDAGVAQAAPLDPRLFIEEAGKTVVTSLTDLAAKPVLVKLTAGDSLTLEHEGNVIRLKDQSGVVIGLIEPKLAQRIAQLIGRGNTYSAAVTGADDQAVRVIVREVHRDPSMGTRASFPMAGAPDSFRGYVKDSLLRYDLDDDDDLTDDSDTEADVEVGAEADPDASPTADVEVSLDDPSVAAAELGEDDDDDDDTPRRSRK